MPEVSSRARGRRPVNNIYPVYILRERKREHIYIEREKERILHGSCGCTLFTHELLAYQKVERVSAGQKTNVCE